MQNVKSAIAIATASLLLTSCGAEVPNLGTMPDNVSQDIPPPPFPYEEAKTLLFSNSLADYTCFVNFDAPTELRCWGDNTHAQASGNSETSVASAVHAIPNLPQADIAHVIIGKSHACTVYLDNSVWCWGDNSSGQIDSRLEPKSDLPVTKLNTNNVFGEGAVRAVTAGDAHTCVVVHDNGQDVWCWGDNSYGQVSGDGMSSESLSFTNVTKTLGLPDDFVTAIAAGKQFTCAAYAASGVWCWGRNDNNQITGEPNTQIVVDETTPTVMPIYKIDGLPRLGLLELKAGSDHMCASYDDGSVWCWGNDQNAQVSAIRKTITLSPGLTIVPNLKKNVLYVATGQNFTCANFKDGNLWCWGRNEYGVIDGLGKEGSFAERLTFIPLVNQSVYLAAGANHVCASYVDGSVMCWGQDSHGQVNGTGKQGKFIQGLSVVPLDGVAPPSDDPDLPDVPDAS